MTSFKIAISYRRDDAPGHVGRLYDGLSARFGTAQIFMDIDAIEPGVDFARHIVQVIKESRVLLVIIGPRWLEVRDEQGNRRLDDPRDFVRIEIETALAHNVPVIPTLVHNATMPSPNDLPVSLSQLAYRNAAELNDTRWHYDVGRLVRFLETVRDPTLPLPPTPPPSPPPSPTPRPAPPPPTSPTPGTRPGLVRILSSKALWISLAPLGVAAAAYGVIVSLPEGGGAENKTPPPPVPSRNVAFVSDRGGDGLDLWAMRTDGSDPVRLTRGFEDIHRPDWSPDGGWIAFPGSRDGNLDIWLVKADGSELRRLTDHPAVDTAPDWSPDGGRIAFGSEREGGDSEIWVTNVDGTGVAQLTDNDVDDDAPDWSPDGELICFESNRDGDYDIYTMDDVGDGISQLTVNAVHDFFPDWSPVGGDIVFRSNEDGDYDIYTIAPDGTDRRKLTSNDAKDHRPAWSADGKALFFDSDLNGNLDIYRMTADGDDIQQLTDSPADESSPTVLPSRDGR